jgi:hypothetical protein
MLEIVKIKQMKTKLKQHKEIIRWIAMIPIAAVIPIMPITIILLGVQLICFGLMFYVGWGY